MESNQVDRKPAYPRAAIVNAPKGVGVYAKVPDEVYHDDQSSLSSSGARLLLPPSTPAHCKWAQSHKVYKRQYDVGHAAHKLFLGEGAVVVPVDVPDWKKVAAREKRDRIRSLGQVPLLIHEWHEAKAMADAIRKDPLGAKLLEAGRAEQSIYWRDEETGARLRARPDWMTSLNGRPVFVDVKTSATANPDEFAKSAARYGYHVQAPWYQAGGEAVLGARPLFLFLVVEKEPPYLVSVHELDQTAVEIGQELMRMAINTFAACTASNEWPGYGPKVHVARLPRWAVIEHENRMESEG